MAENTKRGDLAYVRRVLYYETDKMGIVHHSNYIRWLEEARIDYTRRRGVRYADVEAAGVFMPVVGVSCRYKTGAVYDETVEIYTRLSFFNGVRAEYEYELFSKDSGKKLAEARSTHCFTDARTGRPVNLKKALPEYCAAMTRIAEGDK